MTRRAIAGPGAVVLAFDVGGTDTKSALVDESGALVDVLRTPTPHSKHAAADVVLDHLRELRSGYAWRHPLLRPQAVGLSVPGLVDVPHGTAVYSSNLGWRDVPMRARAESALQLPVALGHDGHAAALAEQRLGAASGREHAVVLAIGTGIAGAVIVDGRIYTGAGFAGEFGHTVVDPDGDPCPCGSVGCLETIASASAIARRYGMLTRTQPAGARPVLAAAASGDRIARRVVDEAIQALAQVLAQLVLFLAPEVVVIGGGLSVAGEDLFGPLRRELASLLTLHQVPPLVPAALHGDAGLVGSALAARLVAAPVGAPA